MKNWEPPDLSGYIPPLSTSALNTIINPSGDSQDRIDAHRHLHKWTSPSNYDTTYLVTLLTVTLVRQANNSPL